MQPQVDTKDDKVYKITHDWFNVPIMNLVQQAKNKNVQHLKLNYYSVAPVTHWIIVLGVTIKGVVTFKSWWVPLFFSQPLRVVTQDVENGLKKNINRFFFKKQKEKQVQEKKKKRIRDGLPTQRE